jgi:hypothetical protein
MTFGREVLAKGMLCTIDLLVLISLYQLLFKLKILFSFVTKQATLMRRSVVLTPSVSVPWLWLVSPSFQEGYIKMLVKMSADNVGT